MLTAPSTLTGATCASAGTAWHVTSVAAASTRLRNAGLGNGFLVFRSGCRHDRESRGESAHHLGVKFGARCGPELAQRFVRRTPGAVRARVGHRVVRVRHVYDARRERDVVANQSTRVAIAVRTFVVQLDDRYVRGQERDRPENSGSQDGVLFDGV